MKSTIFILAISLLSSLAARADQGIMPSPGLNAPTNPLVSCHFANSTLDMTDIYIVAEKAGKGSLVLRMNKELYGNDDDMKNMSPYLIYEGIGVAVTSKQIKLSGSILTMGGATPLDGFNLARKSTQTEDFSGMSMTCVSK